MVAKVAAAARNLSPKQQVAIATASYELGEEVLAACADRGVAATLVRSDGPCLLPRNAGVVITVPENLYKLRSQIERRTFTPCLILLLDPYGLTFRSRSEGDGGGTRAANVSRFRASSLALGCQCMPVVLVEPAPAAFVPDVMHHALGVEALVYADGATIRTAITDDEVGSDLPSPGEPLSSAEEGMTPLDEPISVARHSRSKILLYVAPPVGRVSDLHDQLARIRSYPTVSLRELQRGGNCRLSITSYRDRGLLDQMAIELARRVALVNKQVIIAQDADEFYDSVGPRSALYAMTAANLTSLLVVLGPKALSTRDLEDMLHDIRRFRPDVLVPSFFDGVTVRERDAQ